MFNAGKWRIEFTSKLRKLQERQSVLGTEWNACFKSLMWPSPHTGCQWSFLHLRGFRKFEKSDYWLRHIQFIRPFSPPRETTAPPRTDIKKKKYILIFSENMSRKLQIDYNWQNNPQFTYVLLLQYLAELFLEWEIFQTNFVEKMNTHVSCSATFCRKSCRLWDNVEKYGRVRAHMKI